MRTEYGSDTCSLAHPASPSSVTTTCEARRLLSPAPSVSLKVASLKQTMCVRTVCMHLLSGQYPHLSWSGQPLGLAGPASSFQNGQCMVLRTYSNAPTGSTFPIPNIARKLSTVGFYPLPRAIGLGVVSIWTIDRSLARWLWRDCVLCPFSPPLALVAS